MIKMFSKGRSSRRKEKNQDGSNSKLDLNARSTGSLSRAQASALYNNNTSPGRSCGNYSGIYDDGSASMERSSRGRAMSDGSAADFSMSSPLDFPMEHLQSFSATYGLSPAQKTYIDSRSVPRHTPLKSLVSPTHHGRSLSSSRGPASQQSQSHLRANSTSRIDRDNVYLGDRSLDRQFEQMHLNMQMDNRLNHHDSHYNTTARERSLDREYPHMGARSLERDPSSVSRSRSMDRGGEYNYPSATLPTMPLMSHPSSMPNDRSSHEFRNSLVFEMQVQISDLHKEVSKLQKELDQSREKLSSSMNSIKTFWSPELKKERAVRKEEAAKCNLLNEQLKVTQAELKKHREMLKDLEGRIQSGARTSGPTSGASSPGAASASSSTNDVSALKEEREAQSRELLILKRTVEELEMRIDSQRQTLEARDESIKKLLEMLNNKGINVAKLEEDRQGTDTLRTKLKEEEQRRRQLQDEMRDKDTQIIQLNLEASQFRESHPESVVYTGGDHTLRAKLEAKDSRITSLENEVQHLEDRLLRAKEDSAGISSPPSSSSSSHSSNARDLASAKEKLLRVEIQSLKSEGSQKEAEMAALRLKLETSERQQAEREGYVSVMKDQVAAKEKQATMLQADIEGLQERVKSKEKMVEEKSKESLTLQAEKRRAELEVYEIKDQLEIKANRVNTLQRKIEGLEDTIREKEDQLSQARIQLTSTFTESSSSRDSGTLSAVESGVLAEKDSQIERLKEQREVSEKEHQEEIDLYVKSSQDLKGRLDSLQKDLTSRQTEICELREQNVELQGKKFELESKIRKLESELSERQVDYQRLTLELEESQLKLDKLTKSEAEKQKKEEGQPANFSQQETKQLQSEIDKLHDMLKEAETDKSEKEAEIKDLTEIVKEYKQKMGTLKRNQQTEKKKNAQLLEEARKREDTMSDDASQMSSVIKKSSDRVEELEEALRQSVIITAQREMAMAELQARIEESNTAMEELRLELDSVHQESEEDKERVTLLTEQLADKDQQLTKLCEERQGHMEDVYEMKQEAIQAMISEKDSTLALLELTSTKNQKNMEEIERLTKEKHKLQVQLRDVMSNRMKLREPVVTQEKTSKGRSSRTNSRQNSPTKMLSSPDSAKPSSNTNSNSPTGSNHSSSSKKLSPDSAIQEPTSLESESNTPATQEATQDSVTSPS